MKPAAADDAMRVGPDDQISRLCNEIKAIVSAELDYRSLARLGQTNRLWWQHATPDAYRKNAKEGNSSAILWAAKESVAGAGLGANYKVLDRAIRCGGDVNAVHQGSRDGEYATALHYAAALGRGGIVQQLLGAGANVHALASGFRIFKREGILSTKTGGELSQHGPALLLELKRTKWLPLLLPLMRGHRQVVTLLHAAGATARLALRQERGGQAGSHAVTHAVTAFHLFATMSEEEFLGGDMKTIHRCIWKAGCRDYVNVTTDHDGLAPLHLALEFLNHRMLFRLLRAPALANVDVRSGLGRTPLMHAINLCTEATEPQRRKSLIEAVETLIRHDANVDATSHEVIGESPLVCAILADADDWGRAFRDLKALLMILIENGARINGDGQGPSIIMRLCDKIRQRKGNSSLEHLLDRLVDLGGNVNLAGSGSGTSILLDFIQRYNEVPPKFFKKLVTKYGATLRPSEASEALRSWVRCPRLRSASPGYDVLKLHKQDISADAFYDAWRQAFQAEDKALCQRLVAEGPPPADAASLVAIAVRTPGHSLWANVKDLAFDANYTSTPEDMSFLHMIVRKLRDGDVRETKAIEEAEFFIRRGMSVCIRDYEGFTALQRLRMLASRHVHLMLLIHEAKDAEHGEL